MTTPTDLSRIREIAEEINQLGKAYYLSPSVGFSPYFLELVEKILLSEREREREKTIRECLELVNKAVDCFRPEHDDRYCQDCNSRIDQLDIVEARILNLLQPSKESSHDK